MVFFTFSLVREMCYMFFFIMIRMDKGNRFVFLSLFPSFFSASINDKDKF